MGNCWVSGKVVVYYKASCKIAKKHEKPKERKKKEKKKGTTKVNWGMTVCSRWPYEEEADGRKGDTETKS